MPSPKNHCEQCIELRKALADMLRLVEEGALVRNTLGDGSNDWAIKLIPLVQTLSNARAVLDKTAAF